MENLADSQKFKTWRENLLRNGVDLRGWEELHVVRKSNGEVLFALLRIDAIAPEGVPMLPIVLLRGPFVAVMTVLTNKETKEKSLLLVRQRRVANGELFFEHPAGMMDSSADPYEIALAELREETGLHVDRDQLILMDPEPIYSSPGLDDEGGYYFCVELELSPSEIADLDGRKTGEGSENEFIETKVVPFAEAKKLMRNAMSLLHVYMYEAQLQ